MERKAVFYLFGYLNINLEFGLQSQRIRKHIEKLAHLCLVGNKKSFFVNQIQRWTIIRKSPFHVSCDTAGNRNMHNNEKFQRFLKDYLKS